MSSGTPFGDLLGNLQLACEVDARANAIGDHWLCARELLFEDGNQNGSQHSFFLFFET
jgi:hypothetical protein